MRPLQGLILFMFLVALVALATMLFPGGQFVVHQIAEATYSVVSWVWGVFLFVLGWAALLVWPLVAGFIVRSLLVAQIDRSMDNDHFMQSGYHILIAASGMILLALLQIWIALHAYQDIDGVRVVIDAVSSNQMRWDFFERIPTGWAVWGGIAFVFAYALSPGLQKLEP